MDGLSVKIYDQPTHDIHSLIRRLHHNQAFSLAGYSDAEWYCILGQREGEKTGLGQVLSAAHGQRLLDVLRRRQDDPRFLLAIPKCLYNLPSFCNGEIDWFLGSQGIRIEAHERDMLTDDLAREAGLYPLIEELCHHRVVLIGPEPLRACGFLRYQHFVPISTPNLHHESDGIERAVAGAKRFNKRAVFCISAGVSAAVIIDQLYDWRPGNWYIDCGSIWDAFVGIGGQRQWRAELYADAEKWVEWKRKCLTGA